MTASTALMINTQVTPNWLQISIHSWPFSKKGCEWEPLVSQQAILSFTTIVTEGVIKPEDRGRASSVVQDKETRQALETHPHTHPGASLAS